MFVLKTVTKICVFTCVPKLEFLKTKHSCVVLPLTWIHSWLKHSKADGRFLGRVKVSVQQYFYINIESNDKYVHSHKPGVLHDLSEGLKSGKSSFNRTGSCFNILFCIVGLCLFCGI